jgi:hypothetical protein
MFVYLFGDMCAQGAAALVHRLDPINRTDASPFCIADMIFMFFLLSTLLKYVALLGVTLNSLPCS